MSHIPQLHPERLSGMDVRRDSVRPPSRLPWFVAAGVAAAALLVFFATIEPAASVVDRDLLVTATVRRGPMVREVHGWGTLVPDRTQLVRATEPGIVEAVYAIENQGVRAGDRLVELSNSEVELAAEKASQKFAAARAGMIALSREQADRRLALEAAIADARSALLTAEDELEALRSQAPGQVREIELRRARERVDALALRLKADEERLALITSSTEQQMAMRRDELRWMESILDSEYGRLDALTLRAAGDGIVTRVSAQPGSRAAGGELLAELKLADRMKALIDVYAREGGELAAGQSVVLEAVGGRIDGVVDAVEPATDPRLLRVVVALPVDAPTPTEGARDVKARIHVGTLDDVVFVERPVYARADAWTTLFRLTPDSAAAERVKVRFGRGSVDRLEVLSGLEPGDRIVVSDISGFDDVDGFEIE
ncbi:MAG: efflux RND transporter periplasmic adaptor subunit [Gemmatimonadota bacterium]